MIKKLLGLIILVAVGLGLFVAYERYSEGPAEQAGKDIDEAVNKVKEVFQSSDSDPGTAESIGEKLDDAMKQLEE